MRNGTAVGTVLLAVLSACSMGAASIAGAGPAGQRSFNVGGFDSVESAGSYDVVITVGGQPSVRAEGDETALERLEVRVENGRLRIGSRPGSWTSHGPTTVYVTAPSLKAASTSGSGNIQIGPVQAPQFSAETSGSGNINVDRVESDAAQFAIHGSGNIRAAGRARQTSLSIAGSGNGNLGGLQAENADVSIAGSGDASVHATGAASVNVAGSGSVQVTGGARCNVTKAGSGDVHCG